MEILEETEQFVYYRENGKLLGFSNYSKYSSKKHLLRKKLLKEVFELAKKDNMENLQILTDESCNWQIYEKLGCKRIYETIVENKEYDKLGNVLIEKAFIYEKKL